MSEVDDEDRGGSKAGSAQSDDKGPKIVVAVAQPRKVAEAVHPDVARKRLTKLLRQYDNVVIGLAKRKTATDDELMKGLSLTDDPATYLRKLGLKDLETLVEICNLLGPALESKSKRRKKACPAGMVSVGILMPLAIGLAVPAVFETIIGAAQWNDGKCQISKFANGTCWQTEPTKCLLGIDITANVGGKETTLFLREWEPMIEKHPTKPNSNIYVGDAFRCCVPADGKLSCCGWMNPVSLYFCDNWPSDVTQDGEKCNAGDWDCQFKLAEGTVDEVAALQPYVKPHWVIWAMLAFSMALFLGLSIRAFWLLCGKRIIATRAKLSARYERYLEAVALKQKLAEEAFDRAQLEKDNAEFTDDEEDAENAVQPVSGDDGQEAVEAAPVEAVELTPEEKSREEELKEQEEKREAQANEGLDKWTRNSRPPPPPPVDTSTEDDAAKALADEATPKDRPSTAPAASRPGSALSFMSRPSSSKSWFRRGSGSPKQEEASLPGAVETPKTPGTPKKATGDDVFEIEVDHFGKGTSISELILTKHFDHRQHLPPRTPSRREMAAKANLELELELNVPAGFHPSPLGSPTSRPPSSSPKRPRSARSEASFQEQMPPTPSSPTSCTIDAQHRIYEGLQLLDEPATGQGSRPPMSPSSPSSPSRNQRCPSTPEDPHPGMLALLSRPGSSGGMSRPGSAMSRPGSSSALSRASGGGTPARVRQSDGASMAQGRGAAFASAAVRSTLGGGDSRPPSSHGARTASRDLPQ